MGPITLWMFLYFWEHGLRPQKRESAYMVTLTDTPSPPKGSIWSLREFIRWLQYLWSDGSDAANIPLCERRGLCNESRAGRKQQSLDALMPRSYSQRVEEKPCKWEECAFLLGDNTLFSLVILEEHDCNHHWERASTHGCTAHGCPLESAGAWERENS